MLKKVVVAVVLLVVGTLTVGTSTFWARADVAREKLTAKIDSFLGTIDVKRKEIELGTKGLRDGVTQLRKAKVKAEVQSEQLDRRLAPIEDKLANIDTVLKTLRERLSANDVTEIAGVKYQPDELKRLTKQLLDDRQRYALELEGYRKSQDQLQAVVNTLGRKQSEYEGRLATIENQGALIDSRRTALSAMRDATETMEGSGSSFIESVEALEQKVNDLYADIEAELAAENARWSNEPAVASSQLDKLLASAEGSEDLVAQINKTLNSSNSSTVSQ
jgi:RND superfamily putative drug exporter